MAGSPSFERLMFQDLVSKMKQFEAAVDATDFAMLPVDLGKKTQYTTPHQPKKKKGGAPPADYLALEDFIDLGIHLDRGQYADAIPLYYRLKKLLNR